MRFQSSLIGLLAGMSAVWAPQVLAEQEDAPPAESGPATELGIAGPAQSQGWTLDVGGAVVVTPFYEGGEDYRVLPIPYARASFGRDKVSISFPEGVRYNIKNSPFLSYGVGLNVAFGRDEDDDEILRGLGDVETSIGPQVFGSVALSRRLSLSGSAFVDLADGHEGVTASTELGYLLLPPGPQGLLRINAGLDFADGSYNDTFFSISETQAANSALTGAGLPTYEAEGGLNRVSMGAFYLRPLAKKVNLVAIANVGQLVGDAADSPIVQEETAVTAITAITYRF